MRSVDQVVHRQLSVNADLETLSPQVYQQLSRIRSQLRGNLPFLTSSQPFPEYDRKDREAVNSLAYTHRISESVSPPRDLFKLREFYLHETMP